MHLYTIIFTGVKEKSVSQASLLSRRGHVVQTMFLLR
jgi:hypothetical protein